MSELFTGLKLSFLFTELNYTFFSSTRKHGFMEICFKETDGFLNIMFSNLREIEH